MGSPINATSLQIPDVTSRLVPAEGPKVIPVRLDFTGAILSYTLDLTIPFQATQISIIQTMFIDLSDPSCNGLTIQTSQLSVQKIVAKSNTQGYYQCQVPNPPKFTFTAPSGGGVAQVLLMNIDIPGMVWATA